jgi:hypothetical protein
MSSLSRALLPLRRWLVPDERGLGWMPLYTLGYLAFLLAPALFSLGSVRAAASRRMDAAYWSFTALSVLVFLPLYFGAFRHRGPRQLGCILAIAALAHALMPFNPFSNTYTIYALALLPFTGLRLAARPRSSSAAGAVRLAGAAAGLSGVQLRHHRDGGRGGVHRQPPLRPEPAPPGRPAPEPRRSA